MVELAHQWKTDLILAIGPRATTDTSASVHTEEGVRMGYRLRGQEQIVRALEDVKRAARISPPPSTYCTPSFLFQVFLYL